MPSHYRKKRSNNAPTVNVHTTQVTVDAQAQLQVILALLLNIGATGGVAPGLLNRTH